MRSKVFAGILAALPLFPITPAAAATTVTVLTSVLGTTPQYIGFSQGDFVANTNTSAWIDYSNANGIRMWSSPSIYPTEVSGVSVTTQSQFDARKAALRANPTSNTYIDWTTFQSKTSTKQKNGANNQTLDYALGQLNTHGVHVVEEINRTVSSEVTDWAGKWSQWQHFYAQAFYEAKNYNVSQFEIYNEPDLSSGETPSDLLIRLQVASDAIHSAISDVDRLYGKNLVASVAGPTSAGSSSTAFQTWGQPLLANNRTDFEGNPTSYDLLNTYAFHLYSSNPSTYASRIQYVKDNVASTNVSGNSMPVILTEFNWNTTANFANSTNTLDTPAVYSGLAANLIAATSAGIDGLYAFKFSQVPYAGPSGTIPQPTGFYYLDSANTDNVTGATHAAEVYRLYAKAFKGARQRLATSAPQVGGTYTVSADYDSASSTYYSYASNTDTNPNVVTMDLTSWNILAGTQITIEEVSGRHDGSVASIVTVPANKQITFTQPANSVTLVTASPKQQVTVSLPAIANAMVRNNASVPSSKTTNFGGSTTANVARNTAGDNYATYLKFNTAGQALIADASRAILEVTGKNSTSSIATFEVYGVRSSTWAESTLTWSNGPDLSSTAPLMTNVGTDAFPLGHLSFDASTTTEMLDVSDFVNEFGGSLLTFVLVREQQFSGDANDGNLVTLSTWESAAAPQLLILNNVPEPSSALLLAVASSLMLRRRRSHLCFR